MTRRDDGFILVETIVAFAILALALGVTMQTISQSARTIVRADDIRAAGLAYDLLAAEKFASFSGEGDFEGELDDGAAWRAQVRAIRDDHVRPLLAVSARIWPRGRSGPSYLYRTFVSNPVPQAP
jgi:general secretion pathway protein I